MWLGLFFLFFFFFFPEDYSLGGLGDSYYEYLLKQWLQTDKTENRFKIWYDESAQGIKRVMVGHATSDGEEFTYVGKYRNSYLEPSMEHLACFSGGMFALGSVTGASSTSERDLALGRELTRTCRASYAHQASGFGPEKFRFSPSRIEPDGSSRYYILRPEYVESLFYLWRITKEKKYREWGWDVVVALETHCRTPTGYSGLNDVSSGSPQKNDVQESFFLAETLKYLYLLFCDDDVIPLDKFVFNTEAHPLPVFVPTAFSFPDPPDMRSTDNSSANKDAIGDDGGDNGRDSLGDKDKSTPSDLLLTRLDRDRKREVETNAMPSRIPKLLGRSREERRKMIPR